MTLRTTAIYHAKQAKALLALNGIDNPALSRFQTPDGTRWRFEYRDGDSAYVVILKSASDYREHGGAVDATRTKEANAAPETVSDAAPAPAPVAAPVAPQGRVVALVPAAALAAIVADFEAAERITAAIDAADWMERDSDILAPLF